MSRLRPKAAGQAISQILMAGEINDLFCLEDIPRYGTDGAERIGQAEFDTSRSGPDQAGEDLRIVLQPVRAPYGPRL